jgi:hypothetical protein
MLDLSDAVFSSFSFLRLKQFIHQSKPLLCKGHSTAWVLLAIFGQCLVLTEDIVETRSAPRDTLSLVRRLILVSIYYRYPLIGDSVKAYWLHLGPSVTHSSNFYQPWNSPGGFCPKWLTKLWIRCARTRIMSLAPWIISMHVQKPANRSLEI